MSHRIAIIGTGLIGRAWAIVFARAGCEVALYDPVAGAAERAVTLIASAVDDLASFALVGDPAAILSRIAVAGELGAALADADYVQENAPERVELKRALFAAIDEHLGPRTIVGSSSSGIPASAFTEAVACRGRCLIAHPVNPPHLIPVVELVPAPWTEPAAMAQAQSLMREVGQAPVSLRREVEGFLLNRLQAVLLTEAWRLFEQGYASTTDIDLTISEGLGLRWSFMGPFETIDLNAPAGVADYASRFGALIAGIDAEPKSREPWSPELIANVERERRQTLKQTDIDDRMQWRDRRLMALAAWRKSGSGGRNAA